MLRQHPPNKQRLLQSETSSQACYGSPAKILAVTGTLWALSVLPAGATTTEDLTKACLDDDSRWARYNSSCAQMGQFCKSPGYGVLVRSWCPRTCGLCTPSNAEDVDVTSDTVSLVSWFAAIKKDGRRRDPDDPSAPGESSNLNRRRLQQSAARNASNSQPNDTSTSDNTTNEPISSRLFPGTFAQATDATGAVNETNKTNLTSEYSAASPLKWPEEWEISLPLQDALIEAAQSSLLMPRALWSPGQEHFIFEEANTTSDNMSTMTSTTTEASVERAPLFKRLVGRLQRQGCPLGYERVVGHVYGGDQFGRGYRLFTDSVKKCARLCTETPGCGSFEYSSENKRCFRNTLTRPTDMQDRHNYVFCRRTPCPSFLTEAACVGPAVEAGYHSREVRMQAGTYCIWSAGKCQAPVACTTEDCFLPDGGLPGMNLPPRFTLWISRSGIMSTMEKMAAFSSFTL